MTIERFTKEQFEEALTNIGHWEAEGLLNGEEVYAIPVNNSARLIVRSSVGRNGIAADTGEDSIRLWIETFRPDWKNPENLIWQASGKKVDAYTTRVPGWADRLAGKVEKLYDKAKEVRKPINTCPKCGKAPWVGFTKSGKNEGRPYASCRKCNHFEWLDEEPAKVIEFEVPEEELAQVDAPEPKKQEERKSAVNTAVVQNEDEMLKAMKSSLKAKKSVGTAMNYVREPNDSQKAVIEADPNDDIRLMAPPGSGKTFVIEHRYQFLVKSGISPDNILVVTYSKKMADEMLERIEATAGTVNREQISTIHAFCYRLLTRWDSSSQFFGWSVPKDWQVKKIVDELVEKIWEIDEENPEDERPGWKEIMTWVDTSKNYGHTIEQSREFFIRNLGAQFGEWLYQIRKELDSALAYQKSMTFADMLFQTEQILMNDAQFRSKWQKRFTYIIIDEGQDTNAQAMRILVTLSVDSGNPVYGGV